MSKIDLNTLKVIQYLAKKKNFQLKEIFTFLAFNIGKLNILIFTFTSNVAKQENRTVIIFNHFKI